MRTYLVIVAGLSVLGACSQWTPVDDGGTPVTCDQCPKCPGQPDLLSPTPKCAAAKGLSGDNLLCIDFSSIGDQTLTTPPPAPLTGWDFEKFDKSCWQILSGKLQVKGFSNFMSSCGFLMPSLLASDYGKYSSFTLSVVQTVDLNAQKQTSWIYLGSDLVTQQIATSTGTNPRQQNIYGIAKAALPNGGNNNYQPLFKITSGITIGLAGWQIESIAVMGNL